MQNYTVKSFRQADELLTGRCKESKKLQNNTYLKRRGQDIAVRLHSTDVVTFRPNGDVTLNSGGWTTVTTKDRINKYSPHQVGSERGVWFLYARGYSAGATVPFADGMTVTAAGKIRGVSQTVEDILLEWKETDRENARVSRWKSKARGITRDMSACTDRKDWRGHTTNRCRCFRCGQRPFRPSKLAEMTAETCSHCGCRKVYTPAKTKLTVAQIEAEEHSQVRTAMILCYGLARFLQDADKVVEVTALTPEFKTEDIRTFLKYRIDSYHAIAGMKDAEGNIIVVSGECRNLEDARKWYGQAADSLARKTRGTTEDIIREELLRSL